MSNSKGRSLSKIAKDLDANGNLTSEAVSSDIKLGGATVYNTRSALPVSGNTDGDQAFILDNSRLYIWNDAGWYSVALLNLAPSITSVQDSDGNTTPFNLSETQDITTITIIANDSDGDPLTYVALADSDFAGLASLSQASNVFTVTPFSEDSATTTSGTITFTASDGVNIASSGVQTFTLFFGWTYFNNFEGADVASSSTSSEMVGSVSIVENDGSLSTVLPYAGSKSYFGNSTSQPGNRLAFSIPVQNANSRDIFEIEFWWKASNTNDTYPTTFHLVDDSGGAYFRSNQEPRAGAAALVGGVSVADTRPWCTWSNWNKFTLRHNRTLESNNISLLVNDVVKVTGTQNNTWSGYSGSQGLMIVSFFQFWTAEASDNGVGGYLDNLKFAGYDL